LWICEFCGNRNEFKSILNSEKISEEEITYLVESAPDNIEAPDKVFEKKSLTTPDTFLTYCIDVSTSMDIVIPISNNHETQKKIGFGHFTRLNCVKQACLENLKSLTNTEPNKICSLVTFSDSVRYYGDGSKSSYNKPLINISKKINFDNQKTCDYRKPSFGPCFQLNNNLNFGQSWPGQSKFVDFSKVNNQKLCCEGLSSSIDDEKASDILTNQDKMLKLGSKQPNDLNGISKSFDQLKNIIENLKTEGSTALGPGLVFSVGLSSKNAGSQIILCTDGAANSGMGAFDIYNDLNNNSDSEKFYDNLAEYAKNNSIQINIVSMKGTDCRLAYLSRLADKTNGTMNIVDPEDLSDQFKFISENRILATNVKATLIVNQMYLYIRDTAFEIESGKIMNECDSKQIGIDRIEKLKKSKITKDIGNVTKETEITFEYGIRRQENNEINKLPVFDELPFQLQIEYTHNGSKFLCVYTKKQEFTKDKNKAFKNVEKNGIIFAHNMQTMSEQAMSDNIDSAQLRSGALNKLTDSIGMVKPQALNLQQKIQNQMSMHSYGFGSVCDSAAKTLLSSKKINRNGFF